MKKEKVEIKEVQTYVLVCDFCGCILKSTDFEGSNALATTFFNFSPDEVFHAHVVCLKNAITLFKQKYATIDQFEEKNVL